MMLGVLLSNQDNVTSAFHRLQAQLAKIESALQADDPAQLKSILDKAQNHYQSLIQ